MPAITLENVSFGFSQPVLRGISASFPRGTFSGLLGPNGVGKSTLIKLISRWLPLQGGSIRIHGRPLDRLSPIELARLVAVVEQEQSPLSDITVREMVELGRLPHQKLLSPHTPADRQAVEAAMAQTGVQEFARRRLTTLSGGERQRVRLATALAQTTDVLILDEPTSHLDIKFQLELLTLLRELADRGLSIVAALHDVNLAALFCDHLVLLSGGHVLTAGAPVEVITRETMLEAYQCEVTVFSHPTAGVPQIALNRGG